MLAEDRVRLRHMVDAMEAALRFSLRQGLLRAGLIARPTIQVWAVKPLVFGFVVLFGIGVIRLAKGVAAGRPVGFLIASMLVTCVAGWWLLRGVGRERATAQGKRLLNNCKSVSAGARR